MSYGYPHYDTNWKEYTIEKVTEEDSGWLVQWGGSWGGNWGILVPKTKPYPVIPRVGNTLRLYGSDPYGPPPYGMFVEGHKVFYNKPIADKVGREIKVGDLVMYARSVGQSVGLKLGKVTNITPNNNIQVIGLDDRYTNFELEEKVVTLQYPDRMIVMDRASLPAHYVELLDSY